MKLNYFLVYDDNNVARIREVFIQNEVRLIKSKGKILSLRIIGHESINEVLAPEFEQNRPIYKIVGEVAVRATI